MPSRERRLLDKNKEIRKLKNNLGHYFTNCCVLGVKNEILKQQLKIAIDKLKGIKSYYDDSYADPSTFVNWHIVAQRLANDAADAIKAITALEQKD